MAPSDDSFEYYLDKQPPIAGAMASERVVVKHGPQIYKVARLLTFGDVETGEVTKQELRVTSHRRSPNGVGYDFTQPTQSWGCADEEVGRLTAFLNHEFPQGGEYKLVTDASAADRVIERVRDGSVDVGVLSALAESLAENPDLSEALAVVDAGGLLAVALTRARQLAAIRELRTVIENPASTESQIQKKLEDHCWIFGGRFVGEAARRSLVVLDQLDLPLIRQDGSLHIVELKRAYLPKLFRKHRSHVIVGDDVHEATAQAMNYLRGLDEQRAQILADLKVDCRRARATVVLGHLDFVDGGHTKEQMHDALRTYNSHLSRVEVLTFDELLEGAERSLALGSTAAGEA